MDKIAYHPDGKHIITFKEVPHIYVDNYGVRYTSVTSFIGNYFSKFDKERMSKLCVNSPKYQGLTADEILRQWENEAKRGRDEGTNVHEYAESLMLQVPENEQPSPLSNRCKMLFIQAERAIKNLLVCFKFVAAEMIVFSPRLKIAGMIDLVMYSPATKNIMLFDWKQNKRISKHNQRWKGLKPIGHIQDTDINHYTLQLSLYQMILRKELYFPGFGSYERDLIHLKPNGFSHIDLDYYSYEITEMLKYENRI